MRVPSAKAAAASEMARVVVPNEVEVVSVNGEALHAFSLMRFRERRDLLLNPGHHRLAVRLRPAYDLADEEHRIVYSDSRIIEFDAVADTRYRISFRAPGSAESSGAGEGEAPQIWIEELADLP